MLLMLLVSCGSVVLDIELDRCVEGVRTAERHTPIRCESPIARGGDHLSPESYKVLGIETAVRCFVLRYRELYEEKCGYPLNDTGLWDDAPVGYLPPDTGP